MTMDRADIEPVYLLKPTRAHNMGFDWDLVFNADSVIHICRVLGSLACIGA